MKMTGAALAPLLAVLVLAGAAAVAAALEDAFLLTTKKAVAKKVKDGEEITLTYSITNAGGSTAYDVAFEDDAWPPNFFTTEGDVKKTWDKLEAGASVEHYLLVKPKQKTSWPTPPAHVLYRTASKPGLQESVSNQIADLELMSDKPAKNEFEWLFDLARKYGRFVITLAILLTFIAVVLAPQKPKKYSKSKRR